MVLLLGPVMGAMRLQLAQRGQITPMGMTMTMAGRVRAGEPSSRRFRTSRGEEIEGEKRSRMGGGIVEVEVEVVVVVVVVVVGVVVVVVEVAVMEVAVGEGRNGGTTGRRGRGHELGFILLGWLKVYGRCSLRCRLMKEVSRYGYGPVAIMRGICRRALSQGQDCFMLVLAAIHTPGISILCPWPSPVRAPSP